MNEDDALEMCEVDPFNPPPEVKRWINRLKRCLRSAPEGIGLIVSYGSVGIISLDGRNEQPLVNSSGELDQESILEFNICPKLQVWDGESSNKERKATP